MTWSTPESPVERIPAPIVGASVPQVGASAAQVGASAAQARAPDSSSHDLPDPRYPMPGRSGAAAQAAPSQHLAYPVTPYLQAPYTSPRPVAPYASRTLSIVALCLSGGSFLVALIPVLQFVWWMVGIAGVVCGFIALRREPRGRALAIAAIVLGFISVFGLLLLIVLLLLFFGGIGLLGGFSS